jgi:hypothetical protein
MNFLFAGSKTVKNASFLPWNSFWNAFSVTFNNNVTKGEVDIRSYTADTTLSVEAKGNTLTEGVKNYIYAKTIDAQVEFITERPATGSITYGFTSNTAIWGEGGSNAEESFVVKVYVGDEEIGSATLNNIGGIIDGDVYVTWSIPFAGSNDEYWTVQWKEGHPNTAQQPTKVALFSDGVKVAENAVQMNCPDNLNPVVWEELPGLIKIVTDLKGTGTAEDPFLIGCVEELL